jgi:adenosylcobyric acid synthase
MNPVILKPSSDQISQVILRGKAIGNRSALDYFSNTDQLYKESLESLGYLRSKYEFIVIEGAGSCAEVNLREWYFVNFKTAHSSDAPVLLVADIDRGGVFAQIIGPLAVLPDEG